MLPLHRGGQKSNGAEGERGIALNSLDSAILAERQSRLLHAALLGRADTASQGEFGEFVFFWPCERLPIDRRALCFVWCFAQAWGGPAAAAGDCAEETPEEDLGKSPGVDCACAKGRKDRRWEGLSAGDGWGPVSCVLFGRCFQAEAAPWHSADGCLSVAPLDSGTLSMCAHTGAVKGGRRRGMGDGRRGAAGWNV